LPPRKLKDNDRAADPLAAPAAMLPPLLSPRKLKDNDDTPASAGAGGGSKDGMNKNLLVLTSIVPVAVVFPPPDGMVIAVVVGAVDIRNRKSKADPIIANPPSLAGGEGALSSSSQYNSWETSWKDAYQPTHNFLHACDLKKSVG
jgi:hypothetical protein